MPFLLLLLGTLALLAFLFPNFGFCNASFSLLLVLLAFLFPNSYSCNASFSLLFSLLAFPFFKFRFLQRFFPTQSPPFSIPFSNFPTIATHFPLSTSTFQRSLFRISSYHNAFSPLNLHLPAFPSSNFLTIQRCLSLHQSFLPRQTIRHAERPIPHPRIWVLRFPQQWSRSLSKISLHLIPK